MLMSTLSHRKSHPRKVSEYSINSFNRKSAYFGNAEGLNLGNCPTPMQRWILNGHHLDRAVYSGKYVAFDLFHFQKLSNELLYSHFCACITHQGAKGNGFVLC